MRAARDLLLVCLVTLVPWFGRGPPSVGLGEPAGAAPWVAPASAIRTAARMDALALPVDLNRATVEELASLDGVGRKLGERIIAARPFRTVDDVLRVRGIGPKKLVRMRARLRVSH